MRRSFNGSPGKAFIFLQRRMPFACLVLLCASSFAQTDAPVQITLARAIDLAVKQNRNLKLAGLNITSMEHKKEEARSDYFPHIKNDSKLTYITELAGVAIPAGAFGDHPSTGLIPSRELFIDQGSSLSYTSGTNLDQPLTQLFRVHEANRAAASDVRSAHIELERDQNDLVLKVRQIYYQILIAQLKEQADLDEVSADEVKASEDESDVSRGNALTVASMESHAAVLEAKQAALTEKLAIHDLTMTLADMLGLPVHASLQLDSSDPEVEATPPSRSECLRIARDSSPDLRLAQQAVEKAHAGLSAAKDNYIPDITGLAHYSYQSGVPLLVHNFGIFGFSVSYDLFDGGHRIAEIKGARTDLEKAELNLQQVEEELAVQVETAYDKVEQLHDMVGVAEDALKVRKEASRLADRQFEQNAALASAKSEAHAKQLSSAASLLEAKLGLSLAQSDLKRIMGQIPN
jgi:outer membrane protein TolC